MAKCKGKNNCNTPKEELTLEASGYCFSCAEEFACMLAEADFSKEEIARIAWGKTKEKENS
jgi:arylamine N-acetyltransferase